MRRSTRSDVAVLLQEARALELLVDEAETAGNRMQEYWALSIDLIGLVTDIEELQRARPDAGYEEPEMLDLKRRLRVLTSRYAELVQETE